MLRSTRENRRSTLGLPQVGQEVLNLYSLFLFSIGCYFALTSIYSLPARQALSVPSQLKQHQHAQLQCKAIL